MHLTRLNFSLCAPPRHQRLLYWILREYLPCPYVLDCLKTSTDAGITGVFSFLPLWLLYHWAGVEAEAGIASSSTLASSRSVEQHSIYGGPHLLPHLKSESMVLEEGGGNLKRGFILTLHKFVHGPNAPLSIQCTS